MTTKSDKRLEFLTDVLTTAIEGGINYWGGVSEYKWDVPLGTAYAVVHENEDSGEGVIPEDGYRVDLDVIARGIGVLLEQYKDRPKTSYWWQFVKANRTNGEDGDYDADVADQILQAGIYKSVIFS